MSIELVMSSNRLILCHPPLFLPSIFLRIRVFSSESVLCIRWPKYWSFCFSISPFNEYSGLISFRMDWFDLLGVQGTLKSLLQQFTVQKHKFLWCSAFFIVQLSHSYITTGKKQLWLYGLTVRKVMSLRFNTLSRFVIAFLTRSKRDLLLSKLAIFPRLSLCRGQRSVTAVLLFKRLPSNDLTLLAACVFFAFKSFPNDWSIFSFFFFLNLTFRKEPQA